MKKKEYYNIKNLLSTNAQYLMLLGERANGKSYQVKKTVLERAYRGIEENTGLFVYLRRWREDIKIGNVTSYFDDMPIDKITKGEYETVNCFQGYIYFANIEEDKIKRGARIGRYCALNETERYKSNVFKGYESIVYEEFITDNIYLNNEPDKLQHFVSTVFRDRLGQVFLVGNTLSRVCPYFNEWALKDVLRQKQGTIDIYKYNTFDNGTVTIAVEYCQSAETSNKMFFGNSAKNIVSGVWESNEMPRLPKSYKCYEKLYEILVEYRDFKFMLELLFEPKDGGFICFVYPQTKHKYVERVLSDRASDKPNTTYGLNMDNKVERLINTCFKQAKVFYSDNLTGSDFNNVNKYYHIGTLH